MFANCLLIKKKSQNHQQHFYRWTAGVRWLSVVVEASTNRKAGDEMVLSWAL